MKGKNLNNSQHLDEQLNFIKNEKIRNFIDDFTTSISPQIVSIYMIWLLFMLCEEKLYGIHTSAPWLSLVLALLVGPILLGVLLVVFIAKHFVTMLFKIFSRFRKKAHRKIRLPIKYYLLLQSVLISAYSIFTIHECNKVPSLVLFHSVVLALVVFVCFIYICFKKPIIFLAKIYILLSCFMFIGIYLTFAIMWLLMVYGHG